MGAKKTVQKAGQHEVSLGDIGGKKYDAASKFDGATKYMNESAQKDTTGLHRGRASADAARAFAPSIQKGYKTAAAGKGFAGLANISALKDRGTASALSAGTKRGVQSQDNSIYSAVNIGIGQGAISGRSMGQLAQQEYQNLAQNAQMASQRSNDLRGAAVGLASLGAGKYASGKQAEQDSAITEAWNTLDDKKKAAYGGDIGQFAKESSLGKASWGQKAVGAFGGIQRGYDTGFWG